MMDNQPTTNFIENYTVAMSVTMIDSTNNGLPTLRVYVVPVGTEKLDDDTSKRLLLSIAYGDPDDDSHPGDMAFYSPEGDRVFSKNDGLPDDQDVNKALNAIWTNDEDNDFMPAVQAAVTRTVDTMIAAAAMARSAGVHPQIVLDGLMRMRSGVNVQTEGENNADD